MQKRLLKKELETGMKKYVFSLMTVAVIAFIWENSLQDAPNSSAESRWVLDLVQSTLSVIPGISPVTMYEIRKAAHVTEYMALVFFSRWRSAH